MKTVRFPAFTFLFITATLLVLARAQVRGHWEKTWREPSTAKRGMNIGIAFSGENNVRTALRKSAPVLHRLQGTRYISIGGGNSAGSWSKGTLHDINRAIRSRQFQHYRGIAYNVEEGHSGLSRHFEESFRLARRYGFKVLVAVSHSAPYGIADRNTLMRSFLASRNINYISPMLYESNTRKTCQEQYPISFAILSVPWSWYSSSKAKVVPSLLHGRVYKYAQAYLGRRGVKTFGYIQWCA